ncbi:MAG: agmatinase [Chloroflexi bacterium]|jgi:agmatinase|nr:agmatinase [Chloroflexota bacterium]
MSEKKRYQPVDAMAFPRFEGIRTFMRLPHVTDLSDVDFAIVGVPFDTGGTYRVGARFGPSGIREHSVLLRPYNPVLDVDIFAVCSGVDYGDLPVTPGYLPESHEQIENGAAAIFAAGVIPVFLGGDHSVSLPLLRAAAAKDGPLALVHFDAHSDLWPSYFGGKDTHGTPFRRALEEGLIDPSRSSQIGLRGPLYDAADAQMSNNEGFNVVTGPELHRRDFAEVIKEIQLRAGASPAYLSFDIDFVDPAFAPGTGTPEVGGFTSAQCQELIRGLLGINFVAFDMVEVMPAYDPANITSLLAANLVYDFLSLIALQSQS